MYPLIYIQEETVVKNLKVHTLHRREFFTPVETVYVGDKAFVHMMVLENITSENNTGEPMTFFVNNGKVMNLVLRDIRTGNQPLLMGNGVVDRVN